MAKEKAVKAKPESRNTQYLATTMKSIVQTDIRCRCCGTSLFSAGKLPDEFCTFCEAYGNGKAHNADANPVIKENVLMMGKAMREGAWLDGVKYADAIAEINDPYALYGAANFYAAFSDFTYNDVNYNLEGFMYENSSKRSDDLKKNKYNAMALTSKSREYFYRLLKIATSQTSIDEYMAYLAFMANVKLNRRAYISMTLAVLRGMKLDDSVTHYAEMVYMEKLASAHAAEYVSRMATPGYVNSFYYLASLLAKNKNFDDASSILERLEKSTGMHMASKLLMRISQVEKAMGKE
ncbi:MAG: hypothetical protein KGH72_04955 [Candidatus Micrarchaeota archaeon]|nr:hypothetical protein [Candidatus Micrarchaeota archaeon]